MTFTITALMESRGLDIDLTVGPTETVAILGPNGAGKSTLLGVTAGLLKADSGRAALDQHVLFDRPAGNAPGRTLWQPPYKRGIALLAQDALLFPHLTVLQNVAFGPRSSGASRAEARERAEHWLAEVEIEHLAGRKPAQISGGQAQRVAIARALAADPELLLLDEPMAALDVRTMPLIRRLLKRVLQNRRAIIVTHDVLDALMLADRVVVMDGGRIVEQGPTAQVLEQPRSQFAATLAGLNLVHGLAGPNGLAGSDGTHVWGRIIGSGTGPDGMRPGDVSTSEVPSVAVFAPSSVSIFPTRPEGSPRNCYGVTLTDLEPHGDFIRVRAGHLAADITPAAAAELMLAPGMDVFFVVKATEVAIYPV